MTLIVSGYLIQWKSLFPLGRRHSLLYLFLSSCRNGSSSLSLPVFSVRLNLQVLVWKKVKCKVSNRMNWGWYTREDRRCSDVSQVKSEYWCYRQVLRAGKQVHCHNNKGDACVQLNIFVHINHQFNLQFICQNHPSVELYFHLYGRTNEGLAVQRQSAEMRHFLWKGNYSNAYYGWVTTPRPHLQLAPCYLPTVN